MNKKDYLDKLSAELKNRLREDAAEELLADFNEHFNEALRDGKSEDEVCLMLGDPTEIAAEYCEIMASGAGESGGTPASDDTGIYINLTQMSLLIEPGSDDRFDVELLRNNRVVQDDSLQVRQTRNALQVIQAREHDFVSQMFRAFRFSELVKVRIPQSFTGGMIVKMTSGSARIYGIAISGDVNFHLTSGSIHMQNVASAGQMIIESRSGSINMENCTGELSVGCVSGSVKVKSHNGNVLRAAAYSGSVKVEAARIDKNCIIESKSGSINAEFGSLKADLSMSCRSGSIKFTVRELKGNITGKTNSGNIKGKLAHDTRAVFLLQSSGAGNRFPNAVMPDGSAPVVNLTSRSGRVSVKELL